MNISDWWFVSKIAFSIILIAHEAVWFDSTNCEVTYGIRIRELIYILSIVATRVMQPMLYLSTPKLTREPHVMQDYDLTP